MNMNYKKNTNRKIYSNATRPESRLVDADTVLTFGKYKGKTPVDIILLNKADYLVWLFNNSSSLIFTDGYKRIAGILK